MWDTKTLHFVSRLYFKLYISDNSCSEFYSKVHKGVKQAPDQIRKAGLIESLKELGKYPAYFESELEITITFVLIYKNEIHYNFHAF